MTIRNLETEDVRIRLIGEVAIIHARTTYTSRRPNGSGPITTSGGGGGTVAMRRGPRHARVIEDGEGEGRGPSENPVTAVRGG